MIEAVLEVAKVHYENLEAFFCGFSRVFIDNRSQRCRIPFRQDASLVFRAFKVVGDGVAGPIEVKVLVDDIGVVVI